MTSIRRYFLDTEFYQDEGPHFDSRLISLGLIGEDDTGPGLYAISSVFNCAAAERHDWIRENVLAKLDPKAAHMTPAQIADAIIGYIQPAPRVEIWARNGSFDFYQFCQVFATATEGSSMNVMVARLKAQGIARYDFRDIDELRRITGYPSLPKAPAAEQHIAIQDARWDRDIFPMLIAKARARNPEALAAILS